MTALNWIQKHGVEASLKGSEQIRLDGLNRLNEAQASKVIDFARQNKLSLLAELHALKDHRSSYEEVCRDCVHHSVTCICKGPCTANGIYRGTDWIGCHAFVTKHTRKYTQHAHTLGKK